jgi:hypothetical protein
LERRREWRYGWFGNGTKPQEDSPPDSARQGSSDRPGGLDQRIRSLGRTAIAGLPRSKRTHAAAPFNGAALDRLTTAMGAWVGGLRLDRADFAARFFNRTPDSPAVEHLRQAAQIVAGATTNGAMRDATDQLAADMQAVGLDHWSRFLKDAQDRAEASVLVQPLSDGMRQTAPPPPLDPNRSFVIDHRYFSALARVQATRPRLGTADAPAPILPPGQYRPGLDSLVRRIAGARPGD